MINEKKNKVINLYAELKKLIDNQNYAKSIKTCNKIISENEEDVKAWQCKLIALINMGNFMEANQCLKSCKIVNLLSFEKAYCEYRCNDNEKAITTINQAEQSNKVKELKAQILYRLERFDECFDLYRDLVKYVSDSYDPERLTNLTAVVANRAYDNVKVEVPDAGGNPSYEQLYNKSCALIAACKTSEALKQLQVAEASCIKSLTQENSTEEEITDEVAILRTQKGCCLQMLGKEKEALTTYNAVLQSKPEDQSIVAVMNNNIAAINRDTNVFDTKKRMKIAQSLSVEQKLLSRQRGAILLNQCILSHNTNQDEACEQEIKLIEEKYPIYTLSSTIVKAAHLVRFGKVEESVVILENFAKESPNDSLKAILSCLQLLMSQGKSSKSLDLLMQLDEEDKFKYGVLSTLTVLCVHLGKISTASNLLKNAVEWHKVNKTSKAKFSALCRHCADFHLKNGFPQTAVYFLEELLKLNSSHTNTLAELISAYSQFDSEKAQKLSAQLPDAMTFVNEYDVDNLVLSVGQKYGRKLGGKSTTDASPASPLPGKTSSDKHKKKKKRKVKLPKNYDCNVQPDPDRWLPRWQRQTYKKRRDKRIKDTVGKGTQGVSNELVDKFDITKNPGQGPKVQTPAISEWSGPKRGLQKNRRGKKKK